jgi:hypothetical protein
MWCQRRAGILGMRCRDLHCFKANDDLGDGDEEGECARGLIWGQEDEWRPQEARPAGGVQERRTVRGLSVMVGLGGADSVEARSGRMGGCLPIVVQMRRRDLGVEGGRWRKGANRRVCRRCAPCPETGERESGVVEWIRGFGGLTRTRSGKVRRAGKSAGAVAGVGSSDISVVQALKWGLLVWTLWVGNVTGRRRGAAGARSSRWLPGTGIYVNDVRSYR